MHFSASALVSVAMMALTAAAGPITAAAGLSTDQKQALDDMNAARKAVKSPNLVWDDELASMAFTKASDSIFWQMGPVFTPPESLEMKYIFIKGAPIDPIIGMFNGDPLANPITSVVSLWSNYKWEWNRKPYADSNEPRSKGYTAMIWNTTTKVGMASAKDPFSGDTAVYFYFQKAGNIVGKLPY